MGNLQRRPANVEKSREDGVVEVFMSLVFAVEGVVDGDITDHN